MFLKHRTTAVRAVTCRMRCSLTDLQIVEISASDGTDVNGGDCLMRGHFRDQLWGLASHPAKVTLSDAD